MSPTLIIVVLGVALGGGAYLLYRRSKSAAASSSSSTPVDTSQLEDFAGQIATLQTEIADLQSSTAQGEAGETGTGGTYRVVTGRTTGSGGTTTATLAAPAGLSVTPRKGGADAGWSVVPGAHAYELEITGAGGKGTGTSHYDHAGGGNHASVSLSKGAYKARVRAGTSTAALTGPWTPYKPFAVK
jgi:hypothetical protein